MEVFYNSTRNNAIKLTASEAILKGLSDDGGLFVPDHIPALPVSLEALSQMDYQECAYTIMKEFLTDFTEEELRHCIRSAYDDKFDTPEIAPLAQVNGAYYLELFHGATIAFKDMALSILPHLLTVSARKNHVTNEIVILTATSGDTGKAALAGFADVPGTRIIVFYPKGGVSRIQELQMITQKGSNTEVIGVNGNFDDCQNGVKAMFESKELREKMLNANMQFSSANSINIGRLVPQIVYYVYAYARLVAEERIQAGEKINITVPTGNFGNILAASYAKEMGLPVEKLICASNVNKVLYDFFKTGTYDRKREFVLTSSPSMDILISSNLERLIYTLTGKDDLENRELMAKLKTDGCYEITSQMKEKLSDYVPGFATEEQTLEMIGNTYHNCGYVMDTHTAVAGYVYEKYRKETGDTRPTVIASTASPYKFSRAVMGAIDPAVVEADDFTLIDRLEELSGIAVPKAISEIRHAEIRHKTVCSCADMQDNVCRKLSIR